MVFSKKSLCLPVQLAIKIVARLKVMARLDIAERRVPQDGRIKMRLSKNRAIDFRVSTCPTLFGEKVVTRILDPSSAMLGIDALGYEPVQRELYLKYLAKPQGMILVTGPTGSGKTVSLYTGPQYPQYRGLQYFDSRGSGGNQSAGHQSGERQQQGRAHLCVGFARVSAPGSRCHHGRRNPRFGNGRDCHQGRANRALGLSTLHTNDAPQTLTRLVDMGVKPYAIATSVSLIIAQRLARKLCTNCKQPIDIPAEALKKEGFEAADIESGFRVFKAVGCGQCTDGYKGRMGIYQVMPVTEQIGRIIMQGGGAMDINDQATKDGIWNLRRSGLQKVRDGVTSLEEVNNVTID